MTTAETAQAGSRAGWQTIGHAAARRYLQRSHEADRIAHAYLITGPEQVGKRTLALDLARLVNCKPAPDMFGDDPSPPCGRCVACDRITRGVHADVSVINSHTPIRGVTSATKESTPEQDATRTLISIAHIREMQHDIALNPFEGGRRVIIFDGVDRMSADGAGWNSLLKTLEEPPVGVVIVLLAPAVETLLETVVSRCQVIELQTVPAAEIEKGLIERGVETETAAQLSRLAAGRPGRAFAALEDETTLDRYQQAVLRVLATSAGDIEERFRYAREMAGEFGRNRESVTRELELWVSIWRDILLLKHEVTDSVANIAWTRELTDIAAAVSVDDALRAIEALDMAADGLKRNGMARLVLEVLMLALPPIPAEIVAGIQLGDASETDADGREEPSS